jgi:hypothetical protein
MHQPPGYSNPPSSMYHGSASSPPRPSQARPRGSPDMMAGGYSGGPPGGVCTPVETPDMDMYHSRGVGPPHDNDDGSQMDGNSKDKGRGSYKCGRVSKLLFGISVRSH